MAKTQDHIEFYKWMAPLLDAIDSLGGSAPSQTVISTIAKRLNLPPSVTEQTRSSGSGVKTFANDVAWARQYLVWDGYLDGSKRGIWTLTNKGRNANLSDEDARKIVRNGVLKHRNSNRVKNLSVDERDSVAVQQKQYWIIAPGEGARKWEEFYKKGIIGIGWDAVGDLVKYTTREGMKDALIKAYPGGSTTRRNSSLALWEFSHEIQVGDILIAKQGNSEYLGYGIVTSDYYFDGNRTEYKHLRKVDWKKKGSWHEDVHAIVTKTLTNVTKYPEYVSRIRRQIGIEQAPEISTIVNYWWINANPKVWRIDDYEVGQEQTYSTHNEKGNKRNRFEYFQEVQPGDLVIGYASSPVRKVVAVFEISKGLFTDEDDGKEKISFVIQKFLPNPISWTELADIPELSNCEVLKNNQGSLFKLTQSEFNAILGYDAPASDIDNEYTLEDALQDLFMEEAELTRILNALQLKQNIILQGPPGTGKTFMARRLAYAQLEEKDPSKIEMVQFHQSYSYEDFVQGYRPKEDGSFRLENGVFYRFCKRALADPENDYFFIIDEINRGNLSKIFGELMLLIEKDKRDKDYAVSLIYSQSLDNRFFIPKNVYIIGTMNTADRSLAMVDYALRRRFAFISTAPLFNDKFVTELVQQGVGMKVIQKIQQKFTELNANITSDQNLGPGFQIGHSYFCNVSDEMEDDEWYSQIVEQEIAPMLNEYWFDDLERANQAIHKLLS